MLMNIEEWSKFSNFKIIKTIIKQLFIDLGNEILDFKPIIKELASSILFIFLNILLILLSPLVFIYIKYVMFCLKTQKECKKCKIIKSRYILKYDPTYINSYNQKYDLDRLLLPYVEWIHKKSFKTFINIVNYTSNCYGYIIPFFKVCYRLMVGKYKKIYNKYVIKEIPKDEQLKEN